MLVDDGEGVVFARTLFEKISSLNFVGFFSQLLETNGRFRPVYWFYQMVVWFVGRNSYQFHHFAHMLVIGTGMLFVYLIVRQLTNSRWLSFFASLFFLLTPLNTENLFRLGPQEPLMLVFLGLFFLLLIKGRRLLLPCLVLVLAIFTKETSIAVFPILFFYYVYGRQSNIVKNKKQGLYIWITVCVSVLVMILTTLLQRGGYSTNYSFNTVAILDNMTIYFKELTDNTSLIFPLIPFIYIVRIGVGLIKKRNIFDSKLDLFEFVFFAGFILFLGIQLPWKYALVRYLMPAGYFLILFSFIEIYSSLKILRKFKFVKNHKRILIVFLTLIAFYAFALMGLDVVLKASSSVSNYGAFKRMAEYPKNTILLMNMREGESTMELVYETQVHLSEFWGRGDIKVEYLDWQNLPTGKYIIADSDQFPRAVPRAELNKRFNNKFTFVDNNSRRLVLTTPLELIKQAVKKVVQYLIYKKQITGDGIYAYYSNYSSWYFFHE
jgi:hypothetical protein